MKLVAASETPVTCEAAILHQLRAPKGAPPPPIVQIIAAFMITSANGVHQVLVMEPVVLLFPFLCRNKCQGKMQSLVRQALEGLAFMHARGIAHGDLHAYNIGLALPGLDDIDEVALLQNDGAPEVIPLIHEDPDRDPASFPPYLCREFRAFDTVLAKHCPSLVPRDLQLRILDLGNAYFTDSGKSPRSTTPVGYAAPEVSFVRIALQDKNAPWDSQADIWSAACLIYSLAAFTPLFRHHAVLGLLSEIAALCGGAPEEWVQHLPKDLEFTADRADTLWVERTERLNTNGMVGEDADGLVRLLRRMLIIDPKARPTAAELLQDAYLVAPAAVGQPQELPSPFLAA